jgi:hypothetical protein
MVPVKTPAGQVELSTRRLRLSQRHRTVLLLVDGRRTEIEVRYLAAQAGVPETCFDELLGLSLIAVPEAKRSPAAGAAAAAAAAGPGARVSAAPAPLEARAAETRPAEASPAGASTAFPSTQPADAAESTGPSPFTPGTADGAAPVPAPRTPVASAGPIPLVVVNDSLLPASGTLAPDSSALDSVLAGPQPPDSWLPPESDDDDYEVVDAVFAQAREMLLRAVRAEAPWAGSLTLLRLKRARTRTDLNELLDEVESRISKPHRSLASAQLLTSVRQLLATDVDSSRSAA